MDEQRVRVNGIELNVATAGQGDPVVLLHGWPHTWRVWSEVAPALTDRHLVIAPDLRGLGNSDRPTAGYDLNTLADDVTGLLDALGLPKAKVAGIDLGAPIAFFTALREPQRVERLVVMEAFIGTPPRAAPWWFGFHAVPGLAERVLVGHEDDYVDFFLRAGTQGRGVPAPVRDAFVAAYRGGEALRGGFEHYRAMPENASAIAKLTEHRRLTVPTLVIGGAVVGGATLAQLQPIADDVRGHLIPDGGHILPLDRPQELVELMVPFLN